jgi:hypothetical protein
MLDMVKNQVGLDSAPSVRPKRSQARKLVGHRLSQTTSIPAPAGVRFSGECPGPRESTADYLSRPDDLLRHLGVQDRLHVSTTVVSTALAAGISIRRSDLPLPRRGVRLAHSTHCSGGETPRPVRAQTGNVGPFAGVALPEGRPTRHLPAANRHQWRAWPWTTGGGPCV